MTYMVSTSNGRLKIAAASVVEARREAEKTFPVGTRILSIVAQ